MKRYKFGIEKKLLLWLCICSVILLLLFGVITNAVLNGNEESHIKQYMTEQLRYLNAVVRQQLYFGMHPVEMESFPLIAEAVAQDYFALLGDPVNCYTTYGECIYASYQANLDRDRTDIEFALDGQNAYTIVSDNGKTTVYASLRIFVDGEYLGILRLCRDYTEDYRALRSTLMHLMSAVAALMMLVTVALGIFMHYAILPVKKLSAEISRNAAEPEHMQILPVQRQDEVGELVEAYNRLAVNGRHQLLQLKREKEALRRSMEYRKSFYDHLTHELKTPVTIMLGYAEMMEQTALEDREFAEKGLKEIICEGKRLRDMVSGLLEESVDLNDCGAYERVDLCELLSEVCAAMEFKAQKYGAHIISHLSEGKTTGEPQRLRQLFVNLLDNAIKYGISGEKIEVEMREEGDFLEIIVRNEAEPDALGNPQKLFTPFYRSRRIAERESGSVGLGLSICKNVAMEHDAELNARQNGRTVEFCLRLRKEEKEAQR